LVSRCSEACWTAALAQSCLHSAFAPVHRHQGG
jgi:hypothetical protein